MSLDEAAPPVDPAALMRSRQYRALLVFAGWSGYSSRRSPGVGAAAPEAARWRTGAVVSM